MRIGELARQTGTSERALRYYEEQNLLSPDRRASATIAEVLDCLADNGDILVPACQGLAPALAADRARIDAAIDDLQATRRLLDAIIETAEKAPPTPQDCLA